MLQISPQMRVLVAVEPIDFRRGLDGLARECRENLAEDPFRGTVFVFRNRRRTAIKILAYDGQGFWLCQKKLETEDTQIVGIPELQRATYNCRVGPAETDRMV